METGYPASLNARAVAGPTAASGASRCEANSAAPQRTAFALTNMSKSNRPPVAGRAGAMGSIRRAAKR